MFNFTQMSATEVEQVIVNFVEEDWTRAYGHAHIVLDDWNLSRGDIAYCLQPGLIQSVTYRDLESEFSQWEESKLVNNQWTSNTIFHLKHWEIEIFFLVVEKIHIVSSFLFALLELSDDFLSDVWEIHEGRLL